MVASPELFLVNKTGQDATVTQLTRSSGRNHAALVTGKTAEKRDNA